MEKIRFGIIGRNFIVDWMMAAMKACEWAEPVAIYSRTMEGAREFAEKYGLLLTFDDLNAMAECEEIDAVYVASPNCCHYEQSKLMLQHGKHVLCEKPAASTATELKYLLLNARDNGVVWLEAMRPVFDDVPDLIRANLDRIGPLRKVRFEYAQYSSRYDAYKAGKPGNTFNRKLSNSALMDMGCYCVHTLAELFGVPKKIWAHSVFLENGYEANGNIQMDYGTFLAEASYGKVYQQITPSVLCGEDGTITIDGFSDNHPKIRIVLRDGTDELIPYTEKSPNNMVCELNAFRECIEGIRDPMHYHINSVITMELIDEARQQAGVWFE